MQISVKVKFEEFGISVENLTAEAIDSVQNDLREVSLMLLNKAHELAASRLHSTRSQFLDALKYDDSVPNRYVLELGEDAVHLDDGYPGFSMLPKLAQGPNSKLSKDGASRYVIIPMPKKGTATNPNNTAHVELASAMRKVMGDRDASKWQKYKDTIDPATGKRNTMERNKTAGSIHPYLAGLTRVREYQKHGVAPISSQHMTFRIASTKKPFKFIHPGYIGAKIFRDLEQFASQEIDRMVQRYT